MSLPLGSSDDMWAESPPRIRVELRMMAGCAHHGYAVIGIGLQLDHVMLTMAVGM
jgi:hypothetical protein